MIIAGTGHRPEDCEDESVVRAKIRGALGDSGASCVISGMAAGYDLWLADEARLLGIEVWAARPWAGHKPRVQDIELYARIIDYASRVIDVDESIDYPGPWVYHKRNEWMVDNATHILSYWSGKPSGGTFACLKYAMKQQKPMRDIYA